MNVLANELHRISSEDLLSRDFTLRSIRAAIEEVFAQMPVYRTYITAQGSSEQDRRYIDWAIGKARKASSAADTSVFDFLQAVLTGTLATDRRREAERVMLVAMRAQQVSGPVMAKGMEDTAFYRFHRLISLNEVGGDPRRFGVPLATFHRTNAERLEHWPSDMLAGSTHDTKRGEDARARLNVLSELPMEWARQVRLWMRMNRSRRTEVEGAEPMPNGCDEYLYYQALVGAWPFDLPVHDEAAMQSFAERVAAFMLKALREGKESSSWDNPNLEYEQAVGQFVHDTLKPAATNPFPEHVARWIERIGRLGAINSLGQTLLRLTVPGVPDTYRGSELWDLSLVDPDNRRPVAYGVRRRLLDVTERIAGALDDPERRRAALAELSQGWKDGREKLHVLRSVLGFRREHPELFRAGSYSPLSASGASAEHVCAFMRSAGEKRAIAVVPRLLVKLWRPERGVDWGDTALELPAGRYRSLLTGEHFDAGVAPLLLSRLLAELPVALLTTV
jgi:(1->4)-alpha-D-glucan 1-alpha-D-glucosylmutase